MAELISTMAQVPLVNGCSAVFEAIDPATGSTVAGVVVTNPVVYGYNLTDLGADESPTILPAAPIFIPVAPDDPQDESGGP